MWYCYIRLGMFPGLLTGTLELNKDLFHYYFLCISFNLFIAAQLLHSIHTYTLKWNKVIYFINI